MSLRIRLFGVVVAAAATPLAVPAEAAHVLGGFHPAAFHAGGFHPAAFLAGGLRPGAFRAGGFHLGGLHPGAFHAGGFHPALHGGYLHHPGAFHRDRDHDLDRFHHPDRDLDPRLHSGAPHRVSLRPLHPGAFHGDPLHPGLDRFAPYRGAFPARLDGARGGHNARLCCAYGGLGYGPYASLAGGYSAAAGGFAVAAGYGAPGGYGAYGGDPGGFGGGSGGGSGGAPDGYGMDGTMTNPAFANPFYGYLKGAADVTTANAQYWKTIEEARLLREESYRSQLETRRKIIEEANWEREDWLRRIDPETNRQRDMARALDRARHDPPLTEVLSARALNDLFRHLSQMQGKGERGPNVPLDQELLERINLTGQASRANVGLLKDKGELQWPLPLTDLEFKDNREHLEQLIKAAVNLAGFGNPVEPGLLKDLKTVLGRLDATLSGAIAEMSPSDYIEAKRHLNLLGDAIRALQDPKGGNYFAGNWTAKGKGKNVAELIEYMSRKGLRFAPAVPGDADAYRALYHALQAFDAGTTAVAGRCRCR